MKTFEPVLIASFEETGTLSADATKTYSYKDIYYETKLAGDEVAEVVGMEVKPPEDPSTNEPAGTIKLSFTTDTKKLPNPSLVIAKDENIAPLLERVVPTPKDLDFMKKWGILTDRSSILRFGLGVGDAINEGILSIPCLQTATIRFRDTIDVNLKAVTNVTQPFRVNLWGYIYPNDVLNAQGAFVINSTYVEPQRRVSRFIPKSMPINTNNWASLPGGAKQDKPEIYYMARRFTNATTIKANEDWYANYTTDGNVASSEEELYWYPNQIENEILIMDTLGIRYNSNLKDACFFDGDSSAHPSRRIPVAMLGYGWAYNCAPGRDLPKDFPLKYYTLPKLYRGFSIGGSSAEAGGLVLRSTADIAANNVKGVATGRQIILK